MSLFGVALDELTVPIIDANTGETVLVPLRSSQIIGLEKLKQHNQSEDDRALLALAMGLGKTMIFSLSATESVLTTNRPAFYSVWRTSILDEVEEEFSRVFRHFAKREPVIHRYPGEVDPSTQPDLVMGTPQFFSTYNFYEGHIHPAITRSFSSATFDEAHHWPARKHLEVLESVQADSKLGMTGTLDRMDDPHLGHRVIELFGEPLFKRLLEDAIASQEVPPPDYRLAAVNIGPLLHQILRGNFSHLTLNKDFAVPELNASYEQEFRKHYEELSHPQSIIVCKSIAHLEQMKALLEDMPVVEIHSGISDTQLDINKKQFFNGHKDGSIALVVDMFTEGVNFPHLGLMMQTATTMSRSKFFQTLGRCTRSDVRFVDVTASQAHIAHVRLFQQRVEDAMRQNRPGYIPAEVSTGGIRIDESVQAFEDVLALESMKDDFFFALGASAMKIHLQREKDHHRNVVLDTGTDIELENGMIVRLMAKESVNVKRWRNELPKNPNGSPDLSPSRQELLEKLGVSIDDIITANFQGSKRANKPSRKDLFLWREDAEAFFESDKFWTGFHIFQSHFGKGRPAFSSLEDLSSIQIAMIEAKDLVKLFDHDGITRTDPQPVRGKAYSVLGDRNGLLDWYSRVQELGRHMPVSFRTRLLQHGIWINDPEIITGLANTLSTVQHALGRCTWHEETFPFTSANPFNVERTRIGIGINAGNTVLVHGAQEGKTIACELKTSVVVPLETLLTHSRTPSNRTSIADAKPHKFVAAVTAEDRARQFAESDYFWIGLEGQQKLIARPPISQYGSLRIPKYVQSRDSILRYTGENFDAEDVFCLYKPLEYDFQSWRRNVREHFDAFPDNIRNQLHEAGYCQDQHSLLTQMAAAFVEQLYASETASTPLTGIKVTSEGPLKVILDRDFTFERTDGTLQSLDTPSLWSIERFIGALRHSSELGKERLSPHEEHALNQAVKATIRLHLMGIDMAVGPESGPEALKHDRLKTIFITALGRSIPAMAEAHAARRAI